MIIDCRCHADKGDLMVALWSTDAPIEPYLRRPKAAGIKLRLLFPLHPTARQQVAHYPDRPLGFAFGLPVDADL